MTGVFMYIFFRSIGQHIYREDCVDNLKWWRKVFTTTFAIDNTPQHMVIMVWYGPKNQIEGINTMIFIAASNYHNVCFQLQGVSHQM